MRRARFVLLIVVFGSGIGNAQELASSFDQLRVLVKPGDTVTITDTAGRESKGSIAELSSTSLVLLVGEDRRDLPESDVSVIRQRRADSLANGAKWGFGIGAALGLLAAASVDWESEGSDAPYVVLGALLYGGIGAGAGVGIDAMISTDQVIFVARRSPAVRRGVALPGGGRRAVFLSLRF